MWQPIETAPTDEPVLLWDGRKVVVARRARHQGHWYVADTYGRLSILVPGLGNHPVSHWMPLPEGPRTDTK